MAPQTTIEKLPLSNSTNGMGIKVVATGTPGTAIDTAVSGTSQFDEEWIWAYNSDSVARLLTIEFGDATAPDHNIKVTIPSQSGLQLIVPGLLLQNAKTVAAFAAATNVITLSGYKNRLT